MRNVQPSARAPEDSSRNRLALIDGLRGVAAMMVVIYHLTANVGKEAFASLPVWLSSLPSFGYLGVYVFFVISGYVITSSIGSSEITGSYLGKYALRRSIRLDPPYWLSMLVAIGMAYLATRLFSDISRPLPTKGELVAHVLYLQDILGLKSIVDVYWTLCLEVQFYLVTLLLLWCTSLRSGSRRADVAAKTRTFAVASLSLLTLSLLQHASVLPEPIPGLFISAWYAFSAGMFCYVWTKHAQFLSILVVGLLATVAVGVVSASLPILTVVATTLLLIAAWRAGKMGSWLSNRLIQYLGKISYSLYLFHPTIGWSTVSLLKKLFGDPSGIGSGVFFLSAGIASSVVSAAIVHRLIEIPSIRWSRKIRLDSTRSPIGRPSESGSA